MLILNESKLPSKYKKLVTIDIKLVAADIYIINDENSW